MNEYLNGVNIVAALILYMYKLQHTYEWYTVFFLYSVLMAGFISDNRVLHISDL